MKIDFLITHLSHGSPGSFYRPYEIVKQLRNHHIDSKILTPFMEDVKNIHDIPIKFLPGINNKFYDSSFAYNKFRKIIYGKHMSKFVSYDKLVVSLSEKITNSLIKNDNDLPDLIQAEQEVASLACLKAKKKLQIPVISDLHNIWAEELFAMGYIKRDSTTFRNLIKIDQQIVDESDRVIVVNDFMKEYLISNLNADKNKIAIVPPGGNPSECDFELINSKRLRLQKVVYAGLVSPREHVDLFVKSIPAVIKKFPKTKFIISKKGEDSKKIKKLCKMLKIKPDFYWYKTREESQKMLEACYIGALPSKDDIPRRLGTPLKLLEYLSYGIPVVANNIGSWCKLIEKYEVGILTNDDPKEFASAICSLIEDQDSYLRIQKNTQNLLKDKFSWQNHVEKILLPLYNKICYG